jgi:hypothetical protein
MDPRLRDLSYSSILTLHTCPRLYQLQKLNAEIDTQEDIESSITFAFGHVVGLGIQLALQGKSQEQCIFELFLFWKPHLFASNPKQVKSFWHAVSAIQTFYSLLANGYLKDWELVYHDNKPAVELGFCINLPDGFRYRGFVDAVLRNKVSGKIMVLEVKTSSATNLNPATYKNSAQAIGYSIVLDHLFPGLSSYEVLYLVYLSKSYKYEPLQFGKSYLQRALWIQELLLDVESIKSYESIEVYPMHGENCVQYYRDCKYLQSCTVSTAYITSPMNQEQLSAYAERESQYTIQVDLADLIKTQIEKDI